MTQRPLRICHVITGLSTGGAETMLLKLLANMDEGEFQQLVISLTDNGQIGPMIEELGVPVVALNMKRGVPHPAVISKLFKQFRRHRPDVVQTWLYHADLVGLIAARLSGVRAVVWNIRCSFMGDGYYRGLSGLVIRLLSVLSRFPAAIVANSQAGRILHEEMGYRSKRWQIIGNGFDLERFKPDAAAGRSVRSDLDLDEGKRLIGLISRWDPIKGFDTFLAAADLVAASEPDTHFILVGEGCTRENEQLANLITPKLTSRVHLCGRREDVPHIVAALDFLCCASDGEGFPNVVGEAMASATPCVATNVGDCAAIIGNTGRIVEPSRPVELAEAFRELLALDAASLHALGDAARQRIEERYGIGQIVTKYENLYRKLVEGYERLSGKQL